MALAVTLAGSTATNLAATGTPTAVAVNVTLTAAVATNEILFLTYGPLGATSVTDTRGNTWGSSSWIVPTTALQIGDTVTINLTVSNPATEGFVASLLKISGMASPTFTAGAGSSGSFPTNPKYGSTSSVTPTAGKVVVVIGMGAIDTGGGGSGTASGGSITPVVGGWSVISNLTAGVGGTVGGFFANGSVRQTQYYQIIEPTTGASYYFDSNTSEPPANSSSWRLGISYFLGDSNTPSDATDVSQARSPGAALLLVSHVDTLGAVVTNRYDTSLPPTVAAAVTHETSLGAGVSLVALDGRRYELLYAHNGNIKRTITKDGGRSWAVATTIATGYQDVAHLIEESSGIAYAALWVESSNTWYLATGARPSGTGDHVYTVRGILVASAKRGASLIRTEGRRLEFAYRTTADVLTIIRCKAASAGSVGTWS